MLVACLLSLVSAQQPAPGDAPAAPPALSGRDVFDLEYAADPRIAPDGSQVVYVRSSMDIRTDDTRRKLWLVGADGSSHRPLTAADGGESQPRWSPDGTRLAWVVRPDRGEDDESRGAEIRVRWLDSGEETVVAALEKGPSGLTWSPDGTQLAFSMFVPADPPPFAVLPEKPEGAKWAPPAVMVEDVRWRADGQGILPRGFHHLFVVPAEGGTPRQVTAGDFHHRGAIAWTADSQGLVFSANREPDWERSPVDSELHHLDLASGALRTLTSREGPDGSPAVSPDGKWVAYTGFDDRRNGHEIARLSLLPLAGGEPRELLPELDRSVQDPRWDASGEAIWFQYDDHGRTRVGRVTLDGAFAEVVDDLGGTALGRPYPGGSFTVADGRVAYTRTSPQRPADVALVAEGEAPVTLTALNEDLLAHRTLGAVEELWTASSHDGLRVQGWLVKPPGYEAGRKYPLLLEIHGGPYANYGPRFSAEMQLYAAAGYLVLYTNPRGSTSYGEAFAAEIHQAYPGNDYHDLMSLVDAAIARGDVDAGRLFVTGGSGGGVLSAWCVANTDRFAAAVVAKPVINWFSFALTADSSVYFTRNWFTAMPWEDPAQYWLRSPMARVADIDTPTMLLTGEDDWRTPMAESEQFYQALVLRGVPTALVRFPGASHSIASKPSRLVSKVAHVLAWFARHDPGAEGAESR